MLSVRDIEAFAERGESMNEELSNAIAGALSSGYAEQSLDELDTYLNGIPPDPPVCKRRMKACQWCSEKRCDARTEKFRREKGCRR